ISSYFSSRRRHTISKRDWSSDVCSSDLDKGPKVIKLNLLKKGVDDNIAEDALILYTDKLQVEKGVTLAEKLANRYSHDSYRNKQNKIKQSLLTKGFSYDIIDTIIQKLDLIFDDDTRSEERRV